MSHVVSLDEDDEHVNILVYGPSGVGKTVFAGSADRVLFLAPEDDGTISARRQGSDALKFKIKHWNDLQKAYDAIQEDFDELQDNFDWIAIDSLTHMQKILMRAILEEAVAENPARDPDIPAIQDWQVYYNRFTRFVQQFNELPINTIYTALVVAHEDTEGNEFVTPDIQGKGYQMSQTICSFMTSYGYMEAKKVNRKKDGEFVRDSEGTILKKTVRQITWEDAGNIRGKDRTDVLAPVTKNKNLQQITDMINSYETQEEEAA